MSDCPGGSSISTSDQTDWTSVSSEITVTSVPKSGNRTAGGFNRKESVAINSTATCNSNMAANMGCNVFHFLML